MYKITCYIKNSESPLYKLTLDNINNEVFGDFNKAFGSIVKFNMNEEFSNGIETFFSVSGIPENATIKELTFLINGYEKALVEKYNIKSFYYTIKIEEDEPKSKLNVLK